MWLNRIYNVDLSVYNSSALSQFTADMPAVAKAVLDAFDAGNFCGTSTCSTCNVTTPCGVPPVIEPTGCLGDCQVYVTLTIARTMTPDLLKGLCGKIAEAAELEADAVTCTVREGDASVFVDATLETFIQGSGQTVQKVMNRLTRSLMNAELPVWVLDVTVDTMSPSPLPSQPPPSPSPPQHSPSPPPPSPSPPPPSPSPSLPEVNCGGLSDDEACEIKIKKCEKNPPKSMNKCKKKCKKDGKKKTPPLCQKACCKLGFFTPA